MLIYNFPVDGDADGCWFGGYWPVLDCCDRESYVRSSLSVLLLFCIRLLRPTLLLFEARSIRSDNLLPSTDCFCCCEKGITAPLLGAGPWWAAVGLREDGPRLVSFADDLNCSTFPGGFCVGEFMVADEIVDAAVVIVEIPLKASLLDASVEAADCCGGPL